MKKGIVAGMAMFACTVSVSALAQDSAPPQDSAPAPESGTVDPAPEAPADAADRADTGLEEIVVTATRREERLQDIPVTVTAVTSRTLGGAGVTDLRNLTSIVPAFNGGRNFGVTQPVIRGVGSSGVSPGDEANVAAYIDGVYQADPFSTALELVEVERVEVLRGPQGTVFGRNATGGLINIITPDPSFNLRGKIAGRYGRMRTGANDYDVRGYVTGGLTDTLAMDFAGLYRENDGYIDDLVGGGELGKARVINLRSKLLFQPSDRAKIVLTGEYGDSNDQPNAVQPVNGNTAGRDTPGAIIPDEPWEAALNVIPATNYERYNLALRTQFEFDGVNLETTSAYMHTRNFQRSDSDASNIVRGGNTFSNGAETYSQEIRLLSNGGGRLNWIVGAYAFHLDAFATFDILSTTSATSPVVNTILQPNVATTSYAGFVEGTYELADDLFLTLGGRYTTEDRKFNQTVNGTRLPFGTAKKSFSKWTYRAALRYNFADDANVYASYSTGFKSGVFNAVGTSSVATDPETIDAMEVGLKADPLNWLRTNISIYHYSYKDLQVQARDATGVSYVLQNAATAEIYGGEIEATAAVTDDLNIRASAAYTHANYDKFPTAQTFEPLPGNNGNAIVENDVSGNHMLRAPRYTFNLGGDWGHDLAGGRLVLTGNVLHSAKVYHDFLNLAVQPAYTLVSSEISWTSPDEAWRLSVWATNLTNEKVFQQINPSPIATTGIYEKPRRVGVGAQFNF